MPDLGLEAAPAARRAIETQARLLLAWNEAINLTSITDPAEVALRHVVDSLSALPLLEGEPPGVSLLDLGSGAGYPGLPLAAWLTASRVTLVESVGKKARFLEVTVAATGLQDRVTVVADRAESVVTTASREGREGWDVVTARAIGSLPDLIELALPLLRLGGLLVAWKRGDMRPELDAGRRAAETLGGARPVVHPVPVAGLDGHILVEVRKLAATPVGYPRDPAARRRRPW